MNIPYKQVIALLLSLIVYGPFVLYLMGFHLFNPSIILTLIYIALIITGISFYNLRGRREERL
ncbi:MAG: hypothetical protein BTN85_0136 [Candidatus Methanohalarchaeum thermophilum]|uniref:Uncharacterized protein n=1 Tax=Methanohalarchaeum thermophilum TaxID=1903181 RepID=A0A1Q6DTL1_METT1|nr:MAG: hypothetical protein BTN85_0136 [Candidatus Methanohalarchaeum thermophilum]